MFKGGVLAETGKTTHHPVDQPDAAQRHGAAQRRDIATEIETVGGSIDSYGGNNSFGVNLETMSTILRPASICSPTFC